MTNHQPCSWCDELNDLADVAAVYCRNCNHRADTPRENCDCRKCAEKARLLRIRDKERDAKGN